jgi:hypothetical protein
MITSEASLDLGERADSELPLKHALTASLITRESLVARSPANSDLARVDAQRHSRSEQSRAPTVLSISPFDVFEPTSDSLLNP